MVALNVERHELRADALCKESVLGTHTIGRRTEVTRLPALHIWLKFQVVIHTSNLDKFRDRMTSDFTC